MPQHHYASRANLPSAGVRRLIGALGAGVLGVAMLAVAAPEVQAAVTACPSSINSCGCTITKPGSYDIDADLNAGQGLTAKGDCIDIKAKNVILDGDFEDIVGAGTGVGIRVFAGATFAQILDTDVSDWNVGIEDDANNAAISDFASTGNASAGVLLRGARNSAVVLGEEVGETVSGPCVLLKNSNNNTLAEMIVAGCTDGIDLVHSSKNTLAGLEAFANAGDGIFLDPGSNNNMLTLNEVGGFGDELDENGANGIEIGKGSKQNKVVGNEASTNDGSDLLDDNPDCDHNTWANNCFINASPACASGLGSFCACML